MQATRFYASLFPDSAVDRVTPLPVDTPSGPAGSVDMVEFTLCGQSFLAISAGPLDPFNHAISLVVHCRDQAELDRYWNALLAGGAAEQCGWLQDRYGVSWQIVPAELADMLADPDRQRARGVAEACCRWSSWTWPSSKRPTASDSCGSPRSNPGGVGCADALAPPGCAPRCAP